MSFFAKKSKADKKKKNENPLKNVKNPFAQVGKNLGGGKSQSLLERAKAWEASVQASCCTFPFLTRDPLESR
jgi:hypothetical protein